MSPNFGIGCLTALFLFASDARIGWSAGTGEEAMSAGVDVENFTPLRTIRVASVNDLMTALDDAHAGDLIEVADGDYHNPQVLRIEGKAGRPRAPIVIRAANRGQARIVGQGGFQIDRCAYVAIEGFSLFHKDVDLACRMTSSHHCRFTRNHIRLDEIIATERLERRLHWLGIDGDDSHHNRVDHNLFEEKHNSGVMDLHRRFRG